jgi:ATP-binding cassette subfamily B protein
MSNSFKRFWKRLSTTPQLIYLVWQATPRLLLLSVAVTLVRSLLPAAQLVINKQILDLIIASIGKTNVDWMFLATLIGIRFGLDILYEILNQVNVSVGLLINDRFTLHANYVLLSQAIKLDLAHYESSEFHDALDRAANSGSTYPVRALSIVTTIFGQTCTLISLIVLLIQFNAAIVLLLLLTNIPAFWLGVHFSGRRFWMLRRQTQSARLVEYLQRVLTHNEFVKEIRLFNLGEYLVGQWQQIRREFNRQSANLVVKYASARGGAGVLSNVGFYGAYIWAIAQTVRGIITVGDFTMYAGAFQQAQNLIPSLLERIAALYEANLYVGQYFEFLSFQPQIVNSSSTKPFPKPINKGLELRDVSFTYPGATTPTLQNLNFKVEPGETIAIVGVNGAGKTTLVKLLTRLYDVSEGEITIDGINLREFDLLELRQNIGVIFQDFSRYNLSVRDNIGFGDLRERENLERIERAALDSGANSVVEKLEKQYETILGKMFSEGIELSGGQWQKIGIARAFMTSAQILILDEPTAALDALAEYELFQKFRDLTKDKTTFFISHRFSTVMLADRIVVLDKSRIVEVGSHLELMENDGLYAQMFRASMASFNKELLEG